MVPACSFFVSFLNNLTDIEMDTIEYIIGRYPYVLSALGELTPLFVRRGQDMPNPVHIDTSAYDEYLVREVKCMNAERLAEMGAERKAKCLRRMYGLRGGIVAIKVVVSLGETILTARTFGTVRGPAEGDRARRSTWIPTPISGASATCHLSVCYSASPIARTVSAPVRSIEFRFRDLSDDSLRDIIGRSFRIPRINPYTMFLIELAACPVHVRFALERMIIDSFGVLLRGIPDRDPETNDRREAFAWR